MKPTYYRIKWRSYGPEYHSVVVRGRRRARRALWRAMVDIYSEGVTLSVVERCRPEFKDVYHGTTDPTGQHGWDHANSRSTRNV